MRRIKIISILLAISLLLTACSGRKAPAQLKESPFLYADGTSLLDASGKQIRLQGKKVEVSAQNPLQEVQLENYLQQQEYNSILLKINGDLIDDSVTPWQMSKKGMQMLTAALNASRRAQKYLFVGIDQYPQEYNAWYEDSDFEENVITVWSEIANAVKEEAYFGGYLLYGYPRPGASEETEALTFYEQILQRICDQLRQIDRYHLLCIGTMTPYLAGEDQYHAFPFVKDHNFMYATSLETLSFYSDQQKTEQDGMAHLTYPGPFWYNVTGVTSLHQIMGSDIDLSYTDYQTRATDVFMVEEENVFARIGAGVVPNSDMGGGELRVWSMRLTQCDENGKEIDIVYDMKTSVDIPFMCDGQSGASYEGSAYETDGSAYLECVDEPTFFYVKDLNIPLEKGKYYRLSVTMKQRGMNKGSRCAPCVEIYNCKEYDLLDRQLVEKCCTALYDEAARVGVPLLFMEVGATPAADNKGGQTFAADVISSIDAYQQSYILQ